MLRKKSASSDVEALLVYPLASRATKRFGRECVVDNESDRCCFMTAGITIPLGEERGVGPKLSTRGGAVAGTGPNRLGILTV